MPVTHFSGLDPHVSLHSLSIVHVKMWIGLNILVKCKYYTYVRPRNKHTHYVCVDLYLYICVLLKIRRPAGEV
jgi:hypothetical protein